MSTDTVYHLDLNRRAIQGARIALLPGDPFRSGIIGERIKNTYHTYCRRLAWKREYCTYIAEIKGTKVLVTSTGIGGPSASIAIDELAQLGVTTFLRVGTTGAIQDYIEIGDVIITTASVRLDGASTHYAPIEFPAVSHIDIVNALVRASQRLGIRYHTGITASSDTFYHGEGRKGFRRYIIKRFQDMTDEWKNLHVLNYEMESSTVLTLTASMGLKGGCVTGVINREGRRISKRDLKRGVENAVEVAIRAVEELIS